MNTQKTFLNRVAFIALCFFTIGSPLAYALTAQTITAFNPATPILFSSGSTFNFNAASQVAQPFAVVNSLNTIIDVPIAVGGGHTCVRTNSNGVKCWGSNDSGQLGDGTGVDGTTPMDVVGLGAGVAAVSAGAAHSCAITTAGGVKCWGNNDTGQLGDSTIVQRLVPVNVTGLSSGIIAVAGGGNHTCAITTAGGIKCWGSNSYGQLGDGTNTDRLDPIDVDGLGGTVIDVRLGYSHTCAVMATGIVKCWGDGIYGQLGAGAAITARNTPGDVSGLSTTALAVEGGNTQSCVLTAGGGVKCWGSNDNGELGNGNTSTQFLPGDVLNLTSGVSQVSTGQYSSCAITTAGQARCWGYIQNSNTPVSIDDFPSSIAHIGVGAYHICVMLADGEIRCWGNGGNASGQLGLGTSDFDPHPTPTKVPGFPVETRLSQTITFTAPANNALSLQATASSALPVSFSTSTYAVCELYGAAVVLLKSGTCTVVADQPGNATYAPAPRVTRSFTVNVIPQVITGFTPVSPIIYIPGGTFTVSPVGGGSGNPVMVESNSPTVCGVSGNTVTMLSLGDCQLVAIQEGNATYGRAPYVFATVVIGSAASVSAQAITGFAPATPIVYTEGGAFTINATGGGSGNPVVIASATPTVCSVAATTVSVLSAGTCTLTANQAGNALYIAAPQLTVNVVVNKGLQTIYFGFIEDKTLANSPVALVANASSGLAVAFASTTPKSCTVSETSVTLNANGDGICTISADQPGNSNFNAATQVTSFFNIGRTAQTITFVPLANKQIGTAPFSIGTTATSALAVALTSATTSVCSVSGVTVTLLAIGTCTINADQAGNGNFNAATQVSQTFSVTDVTPRLKAQLAAGGSHTCVVTGTKGVKCWGTNYEGELGDGTVTDRAAPVDVIGLTGVTAIAAGYQHNCALTNAGGVKCWGRNYHGQLGDSTTTSRSTPVDVVGLTSGVITIAGGGEQTCAITSVGALKCWGANSEGQLGDGTLVDKATAVDVTGLGNGVTDISLGGYHSCALMTSGGVKCWGSNYTGQLGFGTPHAGEKFPTPVDVVALGSGVTKIASAGGHSCVLTSAGGVKCWGSNSNGELGDGTYGNSRSTPQGVTGLASGVDLIAAGSPSCALTTLGQIKCWGGGRNAYTYDSTTQTNIGQPIVNVVDMAVGYDYGCVMISSADVRCWGLNNTGQLGRGNLGYDSPLVPLPVVGLNGSAKVLQVITFYPLPDNYNRGLNASTTSGLPVVLTSSTPQICSVSDTTVTFLAAGTCTIAADQPGDVYYLAASTVSRSFQVTRQATLTEIYPLQKTQVVIGQSFEVASVSTTPAQRGDTITLLDGATVLGTATFDNPDYSYPIPIGALSRGTHNLVARYAGNAAFAPSESVPLILKVTDPNSATAQPSAVQVSATPLSVTVGLDSFGRKYEFPPYTFTVTVSGNAPSGDVTLIRDTTELANVALTNGQATLTGNAFDIGPNTFTVRYSGDDNNKVSTSAPIVLNVNRPAPPTVEITSPATDITVNPMEQSIGPPAITLKFCATASSTTGSIVLEAGSISISNTSSLTYNRTAEADGSGGGYICYDRIRLTPGTYDVRISTGDRFGSQTTSAIRKVTVTGNAITQIAVNATVSSTSITAGTPIVFTGSATSSAGDLAAIDITENNVRIAASGSATLNGASATFSFSVADAPAGTHVYKVRASTSANFSGLSNPITVVVNPGTLAVSLTAPANGATVNSPVPLSMDARNIPGAVSKIEFFDGASLISTYRPAGATTSASVDDSWVNASAGTHTVTVNVTNDAGTVFASAPVTFTVRAAPTVTMSNTGGTFFLPPANIELQATATAQQSSATIASVQFYNGTTLLGTATVSPYEFTWTNVAAGTYNIKARATDSFGSYGESNPYAITVNSAPILNIPAALNGSTVASSTLSFTSTFAAPPNSAISANGRAASISNDRYFVNDLPLQIGANTITVTLTAANGISVNQTFTVTRSGGAALFDMSVSPDQGTTPLTSRLTLTNLGGTFATVLLSCHNPDGDLAAANIITQTALNPVDCTYSAAGVFRPWAAIKDATGKIIWSDAKYVTANSQRGNLDIVRAVYVNMVDALKVGNTTAASNAFFGHAKGKYGDIFAKLGADLPVFAAQLGDIASISASDIHAEITIVRTVDSTKSVFMVYLVLGEDGIWRIESM